MRAIQTVKSAAIVLLLATAMAPAVMAQDAAAEAPDANAQSAPASTETQSVHVQVGRSIILNTQARLRRLVVSNPNVLDTSVTSPTQVVVTAKGPGSSSLILWDEHGTSRIVDVYSDVDIAGLREAIRKAYPQETVEVEAEEGSIMLSGTVTSKTVVDGVLALAGNYSKSVLNSMIVKQEHQKQIMLKVQFAEVDRSKMQQFGINILSTGATNTIGAVSTGQFSPPSFSGTVSQGGATGTTTTTSSSTTTTGAGFSTSNLLNIFLFRPDINLASTIQALQSKNILQILAQPNLMALDGQPAKFLAGGQFPFPVVQGVSSGSTAVTIQFKNFGVGLEFTGTIEGDKVRLKLAPEVSTLDYTNAVTISGFTVPAISTRRAETVIELASGQTFGMAGLLDKRETLQLSRIPGIGDVPILGNLFRSHQIQKSNTDLMVLVTPVIVDPAYEQTPAPVLPEQPIKGLDNQKFDPSLHPFVPGKNETPKSK